MMVSLNGMRIFFSLSLKRLCCSENKDFCCFAISEFNARLGAIPGREGNNVNRNRNASMFLSFVVQVNLTIVNTLPLPKGLFTRFMDGSPGSESLFDYELIENDNVGSVSSLSSMKRLDIPLDLIRLC